MLRNFSLALSFLMSRYYYYVILGLTVLGHCSILRTNIVQDTDLTLTMLFPSYCFYLSVTDGLH